MSKYPFSSSRNRNSPNALEIRSLCLRLDTEEEAEALSAGLSVLCSDVKKRGTRTLHSAFQVMNKMNKMNCLGVAEAFLRWRKRSTMIARDIDIDRAKQSYFNSK